MFKEQSFINVEAKKETETKVAVDSTTATTIKWQDYGGADDYVSAGDHVIRYYKAPNFFNL